MKYSLSILAAICWVTFCGTAAFGKAAYYGKLQMIRMSDVIAVVDIGSVEAANVKGGSWTYGQVASAEVVKVLKGNIPPSIKLYGGEDFICAQCQFEKGRFLVFLKHDGELLTGSNWYLSIRRIDKDQIEWFKDDESIQLERKTFVTVLKEVEEIVQASRARGEQPLPSGAQGVGDESEK